MRFSAVEGSEFAYTLRLKAFLELHGWTVSLPPHDLSPYDLVITAEHNGKQISVNVSHSCPLLLWLPIVGLALLLTELHGKEDNV